MKNKNSRAYLIGGGIASLSVAVQLIKDGHINGEDIKIFDESEFVGGSLYAKDLSSSEGYVMRGVRMFEEETYTATFDLMSQIPSLNSPGKTLREEFVDFNEENESYSKSRLIRAGQVLDSRPLGLNLKDRFSMIKLLFRSEKSLEDKKISQYFTDSFFTSNFWYEFCTVFAFQPWHSLIEFRRYFIRFIQSFPNIDTLETIEISPYNQYEFFILPIIDWLKKQGVEFVLNTRITDLDFIDYKNKKAVSHIHCSCGGVEDKIVVNKYDYVFITLGSITANSSIGSMNQVPSINSEKKDASWALWEKIAQGRPEFGVPSVFNSHIDKSKWTSFTITFRDPLFFNLIEKYINRKVTSFGGLNLVDSNWFTSIVLSYNPYFLNQPKGVSLCWGYGLSSEKEGNFVKKKMSECTGEEILTELIHHLGFEKHLKKILDTSICIPYASPYITSQFLPRKITDRPSVVPSNSLNFAFLGQYSEVPNDVTFTMEYSIRSAQVAIHSFFKSDKKIPPIYKGMLNIKVLYEALKTISR